MQTKSKPGCSAGLLDSGDDACALGDCNLFLTGLPESSQQHLGEVLNAVTLKAKQVIHQHDKILTYAVFPCTGLISLTMQGNGKSVEIAMIGNEGFFGLPLFFGTNVCPMTAITQVAGRAVRIKTQDFVDVLRADQPLATALGRYAQAFSVMLAQGGVCHSAHQAEQRCAKWLLMAQDRLGVDEFPLTQESLAQMLGVRRPTVSEVAQRMQREYLISYRQSRIKILNRRGLEELSCACYDVIRREFERMIHRP